MITGTSFNQLPTLSENIDLNSTVAGFSAMYESGNLTSRVGYSNILFRDHMQEIDDLIDVMNDPLINAGIPGINQLTDDLAFKNTDVDFYSAGVSYDDGVWLAHAEASYLDSHTVFFPSATSWYFSFGKRISKLTVYSLIGSNKSSERNIQVPAAVFPLPELEELRNSVDFALNANGIDEKSISIGLRWDFQPNLAFKTQWSYFQVDDGSQLWRDKSIEDVSRQVNVFSFGIDFIF